MRFRTAFRAAVAPLVGAVLLSGCSFHGLYSTPLPGGADLGSHPITIDVNFLDVLDLVPQSSVKVNDVAVGKVDSISLDGWTAKVKLSINGDVDLPKNARAELLQTSLLGEKYVALEAPPTDPAPERLTSGDEIPLANTGRNPEVEEILGSISLVLSGGGLSQVQTIIHELNNVFGGRTSQIRDLLTQLNTFVGALDAQKDAITKSIDSVDSLVTHLNAQKQILTNTLDTLPAALKVLSSQRTQFVTLLDSLSNFGTVATGVINSSNANLTTDLKNLQPILTQLNKAGSNLPNSLALLATAPFPRNVTNDIKGDYLNVGFTFKDLCVSDVTQSKYGTCKPRTATSSLDASQIPDVPGAEG
ncbi:phospholipid/cholesterol/gamma-HCH transport system substrate-binding protein [Jatrophihabitans sp. GAS493]|uniref:MCE family protein n=1 Tax=Jatrophihabitans sp. GAS493 TaxID=1907575 RepID=UPI000BC0CCBF|nr:MCE family protein [Jatrophihabitans sp. GAS493]SOD72377.1 phospholipid/cholesterol/gamma-HCH transport system substrate-binding protein [Jatrophihabitans sp. GAS493]